MKISWTDRVEKSIAQSQGGEEYHTYNEEKEG